LTVDQNSATLHIVMSLEQCEKRRLAGARWADQTGALAWLQAEAQAFKHGLAIREAKGDVFERNGCTTLDQRYGLRVIAQLMRDQQSRKRL
jgi:hypothetical protein